MHQRLVTDIVHNPNEEHEVAVQLAGRRVVDAHVRFFQLLSPETVAAAARAPTRLRARWAQKASAVLEKKMVVFVRIPILRVAVQNIVNCDA